VAPELREILLEDPVQWPESVTKVYGGALKYFEAFRADPAKLLQSWRLLMVHDPEALAEACDGLDWQAQAALDLAARNDAAQASKVPHSVAPRLLRLIALCTR